VTCTVYAHKYGLLEEEGWKCETWKEDAS
jgi:hypothetical protein